MILEVVPDAEQGLAYGAPAFKVRGKTVAGFAAFKNHSSYLPHSGSVLADLGDAVARYETSKGSLKFAIDQPLPKGLVATLIPCACVSSYCPKRHREDATGECDAGSSLRALELLEGASRWVSRPGEQK